MFRKYGLLDESAIRIYSGNSSLYDFSLAFRMNDQQQSSLGDTSATAVIEFELRSSAERAKKEINSRKSDPPFIRADWHTGSLLFQDGNVDDDIVSVYIRYESKIVSAKLLKYILAKLIDPVLFSFSKA